MRADPTVLQNIISEETGLEYEAEAKILKGGEFEYFLKPAGLPLETSFQIRVAPGWRRLRLSFEPGRFARELLVAMSRADQTGRTAFVSILEHCADKGAEITAKVNDVPSSFEAPDIWEKEWNRFSLQLSRGQLGLGLDEGEPDEQIVIRWAGMFASAITAILPVEEETKEMPGYPEGSVTTVQVNRYERDRRNRAAAISIHGKACKACGLDMARKYGTVASGFIEVHHIVPVSEIGGNYQIDPSKDLVPLCPNCHAVVHRRNPPFSVEEVSRMIKKSTDEVPM